MIKVEKIENGMKLEMAGDSHNLIREFNEILKAMYKVLDESLVKSVPFTTEDILHTMVHNAAAKKEEEEER
ncbi:hypothetical protein [Blautia sp. MSJ-19]|uniref:hypothetical protein n=1 Tax=Blautia sp. MSJ-19 TaxID=2841517 RepID=UPI001C0EBEA7|nr:hypothetical protein [Blautia sp. MSJ-19]MBU5481702.1 hypothetical protein [Blautia sp. MSJ-19]